MRALGYRLCLLTAVVGTGCKKETYPPSPFRYQLQAGALDIRGLEVRVNGKPLAMSEGYHQVAPDLLLADPKTRIEVTYPTSCGPTTVALRSKLDVAAETNERSTASMIWWHLVPVDVQSLTVYLDNKRGAKAATVAIGAYSFAVKAAESRVENVWIGACENARNVAVDGAAVGQLPALQERQAALVSIAGDSCYVLANAWYSELQYARGELPHDASAFQPSGRVVAVPAVDYFPASAMPQEKRSAQGGSTEQVTFLEPVACDVAVAINKRAKRSK